MAEILLALGIACTVGHVLMDLLQFRQHVRHIRDWISLGSAVLLVGHVTLTGELSRWVRSF